MRAIIVQAGEPRRLAVQETAPTETVDGLLLVSVKAVSLNHGEVRTALSEGLPGDRLGWDFAGVVQAAPDGCGFAVGDRVAGLAPGGSWAVRIVTPPFLAGHLPADLGFEEGACLPTAGLTAVLALRKAGDLRGRNVLITGATGGVGMIAVQLAAQAGARVTALVRDLTMTQRLMRLGASAVETLSSLSDADPAFDLVVDAVGGPVLGAALGWLASGGVCVACGDAGGALTTFDSFRFRNRTGTPYGGTTLYGFFLGAELTRTPPGPEIEILANLAASRRLDLSISTRASWTHIQEVARDLLDRRISGKAVLTVG